MLQTPTSHTKVPKNRCLHVSGTSQSHYLKPGVGQCDLMEHQVTMPAWKMTPVRGPLLWKQQLKKPVIGAAGLACLSEDVD